MKQVQLNRFHHYLLSLFYTAAAATPTMIVQHPSKIKYLLG